MVKDVLDVCSERCRNPISEVEVFVNTQIDTPGPVSSQEIALGQVWIAKNIRARRRQIKSLWIPDLVSAATIHIADDHRTALRAVEISNRIH